MATYTFFIICLCVIIGSSNGNKSPVVLQLPNEASGVVVPSYSHGIALEMSHWVTVFGSNGGKQSKGFLQLLQNINQRRGGLLIRVGGNSQDAAYADENIPGPIAKTGQLAHRENSGATTYNIKVSSGLFDNMRHLSDEYGIQWVVGLNFENSRNMESAKNLGKSAVEKLGSALYSIQIGNEPDLYSKHGLRPPEWGIAEYRDEWVSWASALSPYLGASKKNIFTGAVICCSWTLKNLFEEGYFDASQEYTNSVTVQRYSSHACFGMSTSDQADYLNHTWITKIPRQIYAEVAKNITSLGKELVMGETNTAACGGIRGLSETFISTLWWVDWQLFLYSIGFSSIQLQLGGPMAHYNPVSHVGGIWIANPIYYGSLLTAEALGTNSNPQVVNIEVESENQAVYTVFHNGTLKYTVLINLDPLNDEVFTLQRENWHHGQLKVKRLTASNIKERRQVYWAGQTLQKAKDGILEGEEKIDIIQCESPRVCHVPVPKGSVALVGLDFGTYITEENIGKNDFENPETQPRSINPLHRGESITLQPTILYLLFIYGLFATLFVM